jgi:hypothetical protein
MKNMARIAASLGVLAAACAGASATIAGCSGDDTVGGGDASTDTTVDAPNDALPPKDATGDTGSEDAADAGLDAADAADAADTSVFPFDASGAQDGQAVTAFVNQAAAAFCAGFKKCCVPDGGAGPWDEAKCELDNGPSGPLHGYGNIFMGAPFAPTGNIALNPAAAQACIADLLSYMCDARTSAWENKTNRDCAQALQGVLPPGTGPTDAGDGGCGIFFECAGNQNCYGGAFGSPIGTCGPLHSDGGTCTSHVNNECQTHGYGTEGAWCDIEDAGAFCKPTVPLDAGCVQTIECQSLICFGGKCVDSITIVPAQNAPGCAKYTDAGPG